MRLYHGTFRENEAKIDRQGLCPPSSCPTVKRKWKLPLCDTEAVYLTNDFLTAHEFGTVVPTRSTPRREATVYEVTSIPKGCRMEPDTEAIVGEAWKIKDCGCIRPERKCRISSTEINEAVSKYQREYGTRWHVLPIGWQDRNCKWVKVGKPYR